MKKSLFRNFSIKCGKSSSIEPNTLHNQKNFEEALSYDSLIVIVFRMQIPTAKIDFKGVINL